MARNLVTVKYVGPHPEIEFEPDGLGIVYLVRGGMIDVDEKMAAALLEQPANWELVTKPQLSKNTPTAEEAK